MNGKKAMIAIYLTAVLAPPDELVCWLMITLRAGVATAAAPLSNTPVWEV
jgi:hypothetical protein